MAQPLEQRAGAFPTPVLCPLIVGRAPECDALCQLVERVKSGRGQVALVCGEAGIGKSRLVAEAKAYAAAQNFLLFQGTCFQMDSSYPYAPLLDLLRSSAARVPLAPDPDPVVVAFARLLPELAPFLSTPPPAPLSDPEQEKRRLFAALVHYFEERASGRPVLFVIEDLHWCDDTSLDALQTLARLCATHPLLLLVTYRDDEAQPSLLRFLAQLHRARLCQEFRLAPLTRSDVDVMLGTMLALPPGERDRLLELIYPLTEGNPFFVEELLTSLASREEGAPAEKRSGYTSYLTGRAEALPVPQSVQEAVRQRTRGLSADARRLLTLAAVAGRRFDVTLLQEIMRCDDVQLLALLKEVMAAQLVSEEAADQFAFRHALTQQAIYADLLVRERRAVHRSIAETLERLSASTFPRERYVEDLARHCYEAGMWEQALAYSQEVGEKALTLYAQQGAIDSFTRAVEASHHLSRTPPARLYLARGTAHETLGDFERARGDYEQALASARAMRDSAMEWQSMIALGFLWSGRGYEQAGEWFYRALDLAEKLADPLLRARSLNRLGNWLVNTGRIEEALRVHQEALSIFEVRADTRGMAETLDLLGTAYGLRGDKVQSVRVQGQAITLFRGLGDDQSLASILATRALQSTLETSETVAHPVRPYDECAHDAGESLRLARQIGSLSAQAFAEISLAYVCSFGGDFGQALAHAGDALRIATAIEHRQWMALAHHALGDTYLLLLQSDAARAALDAGLRLAHDLSSELMTGTLTALYGLACLHAHDLQGAEAALAAIMPREQLPRTLAQRQLAWVWGELALAQGEAARALERADDLLASARGSQSSQPIPYLLKLKGEALVALARYDDAARAFEEAQRGAHLRHDQSALWRIHRSVGLLHRRLKHDDLARSEFRAARQIVEALAAGIDDLSLRDRFLHAAFDLLPGEKLRSRRAADKQAFGGLTVREREVAALVGHGKTSREIADLLVVSERTAEAHVGNILSKLGFTSRAQIAVWARERGLTPPDSLRTSR